MLWISIHRPFLNRGSCVLSGWISYLISSQSPKFILVSPTLKGWARVVMINTEEFLSYDRCPIETDSFIFFGCEGALSILYKRPLISTKLGLSIGSILHRLSIKTLYLTYSEESRLEMARVSPLNVLLSTTAKLHNPQGSEALSTNCQSITPNAQTSDFRSKSGSSISIDE